MRQFQTAARRGIDLDGARFGLAQGATQQRQLTFLSNFKVLHDGAHGGGGVCWRNGGNRGKNSLCGSLGYAMVDALYADHVILVTDDLVAGVNLPASIDRTLVDQSAVPATQATGL